MKKITVFFLILVLFLSTPSFALAAKTNQKPANKKTVGKTVKKATAFSPSYYLRPDKKALIVTFDGLQFAKSANYTLTYSSNGIPQGTIGSIFPKKTETIRTTTLVFGTCSGSVCTYHTKIKNMKLEVSAKLKSGKKFYKIYTIKL